MPWRFVPGLHWPEAGERLDAAAAVGIWRIMRKVFSERAGATFLGEAPRMTVAVRKDCVELVWKIQSGVYLTVNLCRVDGERGMLFAGWGRYWRRLANEKAQMPKVEKCCPLLYGILVGEDPDGVTQMDFGRSAEDCENGFGVDVTLPKGLPLYACLTPAVLNKAERLHVKMMNVYNELVECPPFPDWYSGLGEVWE